MVHASTPTPALPARGRGKAARTGTLGALLLGLVLLFASVLPANAAEEIRSFASAVVLGTDGSVRVTETITVNAEGRRIARGIFRDIPTVLINPDGSRLRSTLEVISVRHNGQPATYEVEGIENGVRIRIGDAAIFLRTGEHRYEIVYTMTRMARRFAEHDEIYWNATGNFWDFPILESVASVTLPPGAIIDDLIGYTGELGSMETEAVRITRTTDTNATFRTLRVLQSGEGMSFAASFQKGVLAEPTMFQDVVYYLSDHRDAILPLIAVLVILLYYYFAWDSVGRDPKRGTVIPLFYPPKGFSPSLVHYVSAMGFRQMGWTAFSAALIDLGVKGLVTIDKQGKTTTITVTGKEPEEKLPPGEAAMFDYFRRQGRVVVDTTNGPKLNEKRGELVKLIEGENRRRYFNLNTGYVLLGIALSLLSLGGLVLSGVLDVVWLLIAVIAGVAVGLLTTVFNAIWRGSTIARFVLVVWVVVGGTNVLGGLTGLFANFGLNTAGVAAASIVLINVVFAVLMRAPTVMGRKVMDEIEGFKMYLETAEANRLNLNNEPQLTVGRFEAILPYAIALGVEKPWSKYFESELAKAAVVGAAGSTYSPGWYHSSSSADGFSPGRISSDFAGIGSTMSSAMIAAQPQASSSSGFSGGGGGGGGGGSGGGGGGGGGGGW